MQRSIGVVVAAVLLGATSATWSMPAVAAVPIPPLTVAPGRLSPGDTATISGTGCVPAPGGATSVAYGGIYRDDVEQHVQPGPDGSWTVQQPVSDYGPRGADTGFTASCQDQGPAGVVERFRYPDLTVHVEPSDDAITASSNAVHEGDQVTFEVNGCNASVSVDGVPLTAGRVPPRFAFTAPVGSAGTVLHITASCLDPNLGNPIFDLFPIDVTVLPDDVPAPAATPGVPIGTAPPPVGSTPPAAATPVAAQPVFTG